MAYDFTISFHLAIHVFSPYHYVVVLLAGSWIGTTYGKEQREGNCRHRVKGPLFKRRQGVSLGCNSAVADLSFVVISIRGGRKNGIENGNEISLTVLFLFMSRREDYCREHGGRERMFGTRVRAITEWNDEVVM